MSQLEQKTLLSNFVFTYLGGVDGSFTMRPDSKMPDGYDPTYSPLVVKPPRRPVEPS
ncbi:hypothetical protein G3O07_24045 [Pseudomonas laurentiana]|uniref:Uncharacterized protein n=1 Tax=Pseudomonas laurentiana TaxID=2364649 RepID=A0A6I5RV45_9PSED|nr:hypothetical protein [Pseudomonas laurentiana]